MVRNLHKDIFYSPILDSAAGLGNECFALDSNIIFERLSAIGFVNTSAAVDNIRSLTKGLKGVVLLFTEFITGFIRVDESWC